MDLFSIASGSSGNCICTGDDHTRVMIDAGISGKRIEAGMNQMDLTTSDCAAILVTHEHSDHISGLGVIARRYGLPIYATGGTIDAIRGCRTVGAIDEGLFREIVPGEDFTIGTLTIHPMAVSHDAAEPVAYTVSSGTKSVGVITDLGVYDALIVEAIRHLDALLIEANHDIRMLQVGSYPYPLKQRILGNQGHLSNEACGQLLSEILHDDIRHILLGHLSQENNFPDLAFEAVRQEITLGDSPYRGTDFPIEVAPRNAVSTRVYV